MKYSELLAKLEGFKKTVEIAKDAEMIDKNANIDDFDLVFADRAENEFSLDDVQLDVMGEPCRIMFIEGET